MYNSKLQKDLSKLVKNLGPEYKRKEFTVDKQNVTNNFKLVATAIRSKNKKITRKLLSDNFGTNGYLSLNPIKNTYIIPTELNKKEKPPYEKTQEVLENIKDKTTEPQLKKDISTVLGVFESKAATKDNVIYKNKSKEKDDKLIEREKIEDIVEKYAKIGKLANNNQISAKKVLNLMKPEGLLDVNGLSSYVGDNDLTNLKKAISHTMRTKAYEKTMYILKTLSKKKSLTNDDARLKKAFGRIAELFERSFNAKENKASKWDKLTFDITSDEDKVFQFLLKQNWTIKLSTAEDSTDINDCIEVFRTDIIESISSIYPKDEYPATNLIEALTNESIDYKNKLSTTELSEFKKFIFSKELPANKKHRRIASNAVDHIIKCIEKANDKISVHSNIIDWLNNINRIFFEDESIKWHDSNDSDSYLLKKLRLLTNEKENSHYGCECNALDPYFKKYDKLYKVIKSVHNDGATYDTFLKDINKLPKISGKSYFAKVFNKFIDKFQKIKGEIDAKNNTQLKVEPINQSKEPKVDNERAFTAASIESKNK